MSDPAPNANPVEGSTTHPKKELSSLIEPAQNAPFWTAILGASCLVLVLLFFMGLVVASLFGYSIPSTAKFSVHVVVALVAAIGSGFLGGWARAEGKIPWFNRKPKLDPVGATPAGESPDAASRGIGFGVGGGIAVLVITLLLTTYVDPKEPETRYTLQFLHLPTAVKAPIAGAEEWAISVDFLVSPSPPGDYKLVLAFCERPDFKKLAADEFIMDNVQAGKAIDQLPRPASGQLYARLLLRDQWRRQVAVSEPVNVTSP